MSENKHICPKSRNVGDKNAMWKGDHVGYGALHDWIKSHKPKPALCENCQQRSVIELANISGKYLRSINDYQWLCRKCHMVLDGRLEKITTSGLQKRFTLDYNKLVELYKQGLNDHEISESLKCNYWRVYSARKYLNLPRNYHSRRIFRRDEYGKFIK